MADQRLIRLPVENTDLAVTLFGMNDQNAALLEQDRPCMRMQFRTEEIDPAAVGVICHTVKFCDYYGFAYRCSREMSEVPLLKIETDTTPQSSGQLHTRLDAFNETIGPADGGDTIKREIRFAAGVDSGSASTDAVILDREKHIVGWAILPTGAGAAAGAEKALSAAQPCGGAFPARQPSPGGVDFAVPSGPEQEK